MAFYRTSRKLVINDERAVQAGGVDEFADLPDEIRQDYIDRGWLTEVSKKEAEESQTPLEVETLTDRQMQALTEHGYDSWEKIAQARDEDLLKVPGIGERAVQHLRGAAKS